MVLWNQNQYPWAGSLLEDPTNFSEERFDGPGVTEKRFRILIRKDAKTDKRPSWVSLPKRAFLFAELKADG